MADVSSVATAPITTPAVQSAPPAEMAKVETAPVAPAAAESSDKGAGIAQGTPTESQAKKLYMTA